MSARTRALARALVGIAAAGVLTAGLAAPASAADPMPVGTHVPATALSPATCTVPATANDHVLKVLLRVGRSRHIGKRVRLAEFETAWVESHANNLPCGDADSVGVFQQRPSAGWCVHPAGCRNIPHATNKFLDQAIPLASAHPTWSAGRIAQGVQRSAFPSRYNESKAKAGQLITRARNLLS
ncbi:MAG: hypothetical protein WCA46_00360 [Actinocatenispora sp.]